MEGSLKTWEQAISDALADHKPGHNSVETVRIIRVAWLMRTQISPIVEKPPPLQNPVPCEKVFLREMKRFFKK